MSAGDSSTPRRKFRIFCTTLIVMLLALPDGGNALIYETNTDSATDATSSVGKRGTRVLDLRTISPEQFDMNGQNIYNAAKFIQRELDETWTNLLKVHEVQHLAKESIGKLKALDSECKERGFSLKEAEANDIHRLRRLLDIVKQKAEVEDKINLQLQDIMNKQVG